MTREFRLNPSMQAAAIFGTVALLLLLALAYFANIEWLALPVALAVAAMLMFFVEDAIFALTATPDHTLLIGVVLVVPGLVLLGILISILQIPIFIIVFITMLIGLRWKVAPQFIEVSLTHLRLPARYREWRWEEFTDIRRTASRLALYVEDELVFNMPRVADREALYDIIVDQVELPLMYRVLAKMRNGAVINFPNVKLTNELVVIDKNAIPINDIENAVLDRWRYLSIYSGSNGIRHIDIQHYILAEELITGKYTTELGNRREVLTVRSPLLNALCRSGIVWKPPRQHIEVYDDGVVISSHENVNRWRWEDFSEIKTRNHRTRLYVNGKVAAEIPALLKTD